MAIEYLLSRLELGFFGNGFTFDQKHLDEVIQIDKFEKERHLGEVTQLKNDLDAMAHEKVKSRSIFHELTERLNDANNMLRDEKVVNSSIKIEHDLLSEQLDNLKADLDTQQMAALTNSCEKDEMIRQLSEKLEKTTAEHRVQLNQQRMEYSKLNERLSSEKDRIEEDLTEKLNEAKSSLLTERQLNSILISDRDTLTQKLSELEADLNGRQEAGNDASEKVEDLVENVNSLQVAYVKDQSEEGCEEQEDQSTQIELKANNNVKKNKLDKKKYR